MALNRVHRAGLVLSCCLDSDGNKAHPYWAISQDAEKMEERTPGGSQSGFSEGA